MKFALSAIVMLATSAVAPNCIDMTRDDRVAEVAEIRASCADDDRDCSCEDTECAADAACCDCTPDGAVSRLLTARGRGGGGRREEGL